VFTLQYKIGGCDVRESGQQVGTRFAGFGMGYQDTYPFNEDTDFRIAVSGCPGSSGATSQHSTTTTKKPPVKPAPPPAAAPAAPVDIEPISIQPPPDTVPVAVHPAAPKSRSVSSWRFVGGTLIALGMLSLAGLILVRRRRAPADLS
jgi:hypothetical protein